MMRALPHPRGSDGLRGLTWNHPRGAAPLHALARLAREHGPLHVAGPPLTWEEQSLAGFESHPIADLARRYDLLVIDHPGLGAAIQAGALIPYDDVADAFDLAQWRTAFVGTSFDSYQYLGRQWGIPIDAATQVCAIRPDLLEEPPATWDDALSLAPHHTICLPAADPHLLIALLGITAAYRPGYSVEPERLLPRDAATEGYAILRRLIDQTPTKLRGLDPIRVLEAMATTEIACCPLIYGYVTYTRPRPGRCVIAFFDAPAAWENGTPGSVLGGTGIALSRRCVDPAGALAHVRQITSDAAQRTTVAESGGQPAARAAWEDAAVNAASADFYRRTRRSLETAWRRPRFPGWISFQTEGSRLLRAEIEQERPAGKALDALDALYRHHR